MTTFARIADDTAQEIFIPPHGKTMEDCFHPAVAELFTQVPDGTLQNATLVDGEWKNPTPPVTDEVEA